MSSAPQSVSGSNTEERQVLLSAYLPESVVTWFQDQRRALGMKPTSGSALYGIAAAFYILGIFLFTAAWTFMGMIYTKLKGNAIIRLLFMLTLYFVIMYTIYYFFFRQENKTPYLKAAKDDILNFFEGFQNAPSPNMESDSAAQPLLNLQPMAIKQVGYIGPKEKGGMFDLDTGLVTAIKSGVRFFTLQIDYLDVKREKDGFDKMGVPTLVYRDDKRGLISSNGANLKEAATLLANYGFSEESLGSKLPLVLYLHFVRTPDPIKKPEEYVKFLSEAAASLEPLTPQILGNSGTGNFSRQQNELGLLRTPIRDLTKKVVFLTNVDTSLFRRTAQLGMKEFEQKRDLDFLANVRVYAETADDILGASNVNGSGEPHALLVSLKRVLSLSKKEKDAFRDMSKTRFIIAMPSQMSNPTRKEFDEAYSLGINIVPMNPFGSNRDELKRVLAIWSSEKFLKLRPPILQSSAAVVPSNT